MWVEPKHIGIYNHSRRSNIFSLDEKNYLRGPKMSFMQTICVVCCWRSNFRLVIVTPLAVKINAPGTASCFKRGRYPACYNQPLLQPAPVSPMLWVMLVGLQHRTLSSKLSTDNQVIGNFCIPADSTNAFGDLSVHTNFRLLYSGLFFSMLRGAK